MLIRKDMNMNEKRLIHSLIFPAFFLLVLWLIKIVEYTLNVSFAEYGIYPREIYGLKGIFFSPMIHGSFDHLIANSFPMFFLMVGIYYFYNKIAYKVFFLSWLLVGVWVWLGGRPAYHIGASGIIYSFLSFLFLSGIIRRHISLMAISLVVAFLYGSMIWGVLPLKPGVSWESHLWGFVAGVILAVFYRKQGPQRPKYSWEMEEDSEEEEDFPHYLFYKDELGGNEYYFNEKDTSDENYHIKYHLKEDEEGIQKNQYLKESEYDTSKRNRKKD